MTTETNAQTPRTNEMFADYEVDMDGVTLRERVTALERELTVALLTAPAEAPVAEWNWREAKFKWLVPYKTEWSLAPLPLYLLPQRPQDSRSATEYADVPMGPVGATYIGDTLLPCPQDARSVREDVIAVFDAAVDNELPSVSTVEYNSHEICKHFASKVRERILATHPAEPAKEKL